MNKMGKLVLSALSVVSFAACAVSSTDEALVLGESQDALTGPSGEGFFGSDTLFPAITQAILEAGLSSDIEYLGSGSGNGEKCMRGQVVNPGGYCNGTKDQTIAPMSRPLNSPVAGEVNNCIAKDGVGVWVDDGETASNAASANVKGAFCGDGTGLGDPTSCAAFDTWGEFVTGSSNPSGTLDLYRRDDASGTTEAFKGFTGCSTFCDSVKAVVFDPTAGPRLSTDTAGTSSLVGVSRTSADPCLAGDSVTVCLGWIVALRPNAVAYAGLEAHIPGANKGLDINGVAPTEDDIRDGDYDFARCLYLNEGTGIREQAEQDFLDWALFTDADRFEEILVDHGFIACTDPTLPGHVALDCP